MGLVNIHCSFLLVSGYWSCWTAAILQRKNAETAQHTCWPTVY